MITNYYGNDFPEDRRLTTVQLPTQFILLIESKPAIKQNSSLLLNALSEKSFVEVNELSVPKQLVMKTGSIFKIILYEGCMQSNWIWIN